MLTTEINYDGFDDVVKFIQSIPKDMVLGKRYEWDCPVCGGHAYGYRARLNGHLHAHCADCGIGVMR